MVPAVYPLPTLIVAAAAFVGLAVSSAQAETLKFAFQGTLNTLDPYSLNETFTLSALGNTYEGLTRRNEKLEIEPSLAESWEVIEPNRWRFHLRKGVKFHDGHVMDAEDVAFSMSADRLWGPEPSAPRGTRYAANIVRVEATGPLTVEVELEAARRGLSPIAAASTTSSTRIWPLGIVE